MAPSDQKTTHNNGELRSASKSLKLARIFQRHELKFLNLGLVIYLCSGVVVFELLGEFNNHQDVSVLSKAQPKGSSSSSSSNNNSSGKSSSLVELRQLSARRMWNITNRLNILYESNWTRLMLDELQDFERQLLDKLMDEATTQEQDSEQQKDDDDGDKDYEKKKSERNSKNRLKSLKKSLIHSLATITTVGFSERIQSSAGKLATVIYGLLGIPLLFCSVAKTGKRVARSSLNGLLIIRHYCFSLPLHYLCCSCSLFACFRCLLWCCCCCCCFSYLCRCLANDKGKRNKKCCDPSEAPRLKLKKWTNTSSRKRPARGEPRDGDTRSGADKRQQTAFVIGATSRGDEDSFEAMDRAPQQKSVRFMGSSKKSPPVKVDKKRDDYDQDDEDDDDDFHYTQSVFLTSLSALSLYLLLGAYFYSTYTNSSLIDSLFVCYSMLSTSKFADQISQSGQIYSSPRTLYDHLANTTTSSNKPIVTGSESIESETIKWIYLLIGLNLISACGHFAQLWLSNKLKLDISSGQQTKKPAPAICNGQIHSLSGSSFQLAPSEESSEQKGLANQLQLAANIGQIITPADHYQLNIYNQQQQPQNQSQVDLSELFLVQSQLQNPPEEMHQFLAGQVHQHQQQQPLGQASDLSLTSDRSTKSGSLCHHHQLQHHTQNSVEPNSLYAHSIYNTEQQHHRHPSHAHAHAHTHTHLYLAPGPDCTSDQQLGNNFNLSNELDFDETDEMGLVLKSCINNASGSTSSKLRSSSSSTQLSHLNGPIQHQQFSSGATNTSHSSTLSRVRSSFEKQNGQDGSCSINNTINDGSNTISSTTSSRTVKFPQMRPNQHIGFILAPEHQINHNK